MTPSASFQPVDAPDVGMVQAGEDLRLPREPGEPVRFVCEGVGEDLQGHLAVELGVGGLPDLAHAALAQQGGDIVVPEAGAGTERHRGLEKGQVYGKLAEGPQTGGVPEKVEGPSVHPVLRYAAPRLGEPWRGCLSRAGGPAQDAGTAAPQAPGTLCRAPGCGEQGQTGLSCFLAI